jgi:Fe-S cluster biogenesis protein NfuA
MMPFSDEDLCIAIRNYLPQIEAYVSSHNGTMRYLGVKDGTAWIELAGSCNGCSMSSLTTKMVAQRKLRELIHPELVVESIFPGQEDQLPEGLVTDCEG